MGILNVMLNISSGFVHGIDVAVCHEVMFELLKGNKLDKPSVGGLQLLTSVGCYLNRGTYHELSVNY